ncbi:MAG: hypothetical protein WCF30_13640 [Terracidiphilus sp.]
MRERGPGLRGYGTADEAATRQTGAHTAGKHLSVRVMIAGSGGF